MSQFCPNCGTPTEKLFDGGLDRDACPACGWIQYAKTAIGVGALIMRGERILLVERGIPPVGRWTLPSGWIEQEDDISAAIVREVQEETALDVTSLGIICIRNRPKSANNELYICFLCEADPSAEPVPDGYESTEARFVHPNEFDDLNLSPFSRWVAESYLQQRPAPLPLNDSFPGATVFAAFDPMPDPAE